jgi:hypothetical protein
MPTDGRSVNGFVNGRLAKPLDSPSRVFLIAYLLGQSSCFKTQYSTSLLGWSSAQAERGGEVLADLVGVLKLLAVARHGNIQHQDRDSRSLPGGHGHCEYGGRFGDAK